MIRRSFLFAGTVLLVFCSCRSKAKVAQPVSQVQQVTPQPQHPLNIILMIGDGMGLAQVSATMVTNNGLPGFEFFRSMGLVKTSSASDYITDSAAGATAYATGEKTYNGAIGVGIDTLPRKTILEMAEAHGLSTGLVVTCSVTHATPASFFAHQPDREMHRQIAADLYGKGIDFIAGTGKPYFDVTKLKQDGYNVVTGYPLFSYDNHGNLSGQYVMPKGKTMWFYNDSIHPPKYREGRGDFLPDATKAAINNLKLSAAGFFLMVEGSQIDWGGHNNDVDYTMSETVDFDKAISRVLDFARQDGHTLVIVTADHETGGLALVDGSLQKHTITPHYASTHHTGIMVPVYAYGPGSEQFTGIMENTDIFKKIKALYGF